MKGKFKKNILLLTTLIILFVWLSPQTLLAAPDTPVISTYPAYISPAKPVPPQNQKQANSFIVDMVDGPFKTTNTTIVGTALNHYASKYGKIAEGIGATAKKYERAYNVSKNANTYNNFLKNAKNAHIAESKALRAAALGKVLSGASLVNSIAHYNDKSKHRHSSIAFLEQWIRGIKIGTNTADLVGFKPIAPVDICTGLLEDAVSSNSFADMANEWDNPVINNLDYAIDAVNMTAYETMLFWYEFFNSTNDANVLGKPPSGVGVYKPNLYLYPEKRTEVCICFDIPALLTTVIPEYQDSWQVEAFPDGKLKDNMTNVEYDFLFYESEIDRALFTYDSGWLISFDSRSEQFTQILIEYGFNEKEIADFVEFWTDKLDDNADYVMYPQPTEAVDGAMPIRVSPAPESIFRLWFAFEKYCSDKPYPATAEITPINRIGFTLVEWGGFILNE